MDIKTCEAKDRTPELKEKLAEIEKKRAAGRADYNAREVLAELKARHDK